MWTRLRRDMRTSLHFTSMSIADKIFSREKRAKVREEGRAKMGALCAVPLVVGDGVDERVRFVKCRTLYGHRMIWRWESGCWEDVLTAL